MQQKQALLLLGPFISHVFTYWTVMPRLHLPYDEYTMSYDVHITVSLRPPQGDLAIIVRFYGHCGLYDFV